MKGKKIQGSLDNQDIFSLPSTSDYNLIYGRLKSFDPKDYVYADAMKTSILVCEADAYRNGPSPGTVFIFDLHGVTFGHMFRPSVNFIRKSLKFIQEGNPVIIKAIHVLNTAPFFDFIIGMSNTMF